MVTTKELYLQYEKLERFWKLINIKKDLRTLKSRCSSRCSSRCLSTKYKKHN